MCSTLCSTAAAAEFAQLEQAYRVLTDAQARGALDDVLK
jgi:DnaJ-class molecular chaperone